MRYSVQSGDTLQLLAARYFGSVSEYGKIYAANPALQGRGGVSASGEEILVPGEELFIPLVDDPVVPAGLSKQLVMVVEGREYKQVVSGGFNFAADGFAHTFAVTVPIEEREPWRSAFAPFSDTSVRFYDGGELLLAGRIGFVQYDSDLVRITGMSLCGVLQQTCYTPTGGGRSWADASFQSIAERLAEPYGVKIVVSDAAAVLAAEPISEAQISEEETIAQFLVKLAADRGLVLRATPEGWLGVYADDCVGAERFSLDTKENPVADLSVSYDGGQLWSDYTAISDCGVYGDGETITKRLSAVGVQRSRVVKAGSAVAGVAGERLKSEMIRSVTGAVAVSFSLDRWSGYDEKPLRPGDSFSLRAPVQRIEKSVKMVIRTLALESENGRSAKITAVPASGYRGELVKFW